MLGDLHHVLANDYDNPVEIVASLGARPFHCLFRRTLERPVATTNGICERGIRWNPRQRSGQPPVAFVTIASTFEKVVADRDGSQRISGVYCVWSAFALPMRQYGKRQSSSTALWLKSGNLFTFEKAAVNHDLLDELCIRYGSNHTRWTRMTEHPGGVMTCRPPTLPRNLQRSMRTSTFTLRFACIKCRKKVVKKWLLAGKPGGWTWDGRNPASGWWAFCRGFMARPLHPGSDRCCPSAPSMPICRQKLDTQSIRKKPSGIFTTITSRFLYWRGKGGPLHLPPGGWPSHWQRRRCCL